MGGRAGRPPAVLGHSYCYWAILINTCAFKTHRARKGRAGRFHGLPPPRPSPCRAREFIKVSS
jgi:hypothetical protein